MIDRPSVNDTIAIMYADNSDLDGIKTTKIIINTLDLKEANSDIIQAMVVVSKLDDVCMFIHELVSDSTKVDDIYKQNKQALSIIHEFISKKLNIDVYYACDYDEFSLTPNALIITKIDIIDNLIIVDII